MWCLTVPAAGALQVFASLALFNQLRFPLLFFPVALNQLADGRVGPAVAPLSCQRVLPSWYSGGGGGRWEVKPLEVSVARS